MLLVLALRGTNTVKWRFQNEFLGDAQTFRGTARRPCAEGLGTRAAGRDRLRSACGLGIIVIAILVHGCFQDSASPPQPTGLANGDLIITKHTKQNITTNFNDQLHHQYPFVFYGLYAIGKHFNCRSLCPLAQLFPSRRRVSHLPIC